MYTCLLLVLLVAQQDELLIGAAPPTLIDAAPPRPRTTLYYFGASWCAPCKQLEPAILELEKLGYPLQRVDIDRHPELAAEHQIQSVPTVVVVGPSGLEVARLSGVHSSHELAEVYNYAVRGPQTGWWAIQEPGRPARTVWGVKRWDRTAGSWVVNWDESQQPAARPTRRPVQPQAAPPVLLLNRPPVYAAPRAWCPTGFG